MNIKTLVVGKLDNNVYILEKDNNYIVIDPADAYEEIKKNIKGKLLAVLITHRHFDHIGALNDFLKDDSLKVYDINNLREGKIKIENFMMEVIYTKGHSKDSVSYYFPEENILFSGDFLFYESVGRCDFPGGSNEEMLLSIAKIKKYPDNMIIYPGHGRRTTLGHEKKYNIYFN